MNESRKAIQIGYVLVNLFEFWEYEITCFDLGTNSVGLSHSMLMFLKFKQESSGYASSVQSEDDKDKYIENYRRAEGIALENELI